MWIVHVLRVHDKLCFKELLRPTSMISYIWKRAGETGFSPCILGTVSPGSPRFLLAWIVITTLRTCKSRGECCLSHQPAPGVYWSGGFLLAFSAGGSTRSGTVVGADTAEVRAGVRQSCSVILTVWPRKSALSYREEEDRDVAAAVRASVAAKRQEEKKRVEDKEDSSSRGKKEDLRDSEVLSSKRVPKSSNDATG